MGVGGNDVPKNALLTLMKYKCFLCGIPKARKTCKNLFLPILLFRPVFYPTNGTFFVELVPKKGPFSTVPFQLHCSVVCPDILSTVVLEYYVPLVGEGEGGGGEGRARGDSGSCSGVLKYAVT